MLTLALMSVLATAQAALAVNTPPLDYAFTITNYGDGAVGMPAQLFGYNQTCQCSLVRSGVQYMGSR